VYVRTEGIKTHREGNGTPANHVAPPLRHARTSELVARVQALAEERDELHRQAEELARRLVTRDELLGVLSHDLKNSLTVVWGYAQYALRHTSTPAWTADQVEDDLIRLGRSVTTMSRQIAQLGDVTVMPVGRSPSLELLPCDLVALALQVATAYQAMTDRHNLRVESAAPRLVGSWDAVRLARVLANLLSNAIKYSPDAGEIVVTLAPEQMPEGIAAVIAVRDHGIGIPAADLPLLFTPFHRAANVGLVGGTGLGLASVKQIVELHRGTIAAESQEGIGTTVTIHLPLAMPSENAARPQ
jgi:signal transduction histidine kinase